MNEAKKQEALDKIIKLAEKIHLPQGTRNDLREIYKLVKEI